MNKNMVSRVCTDNVEWRRNGGSNEKMSGLVYCVCACVSQAWLQSGSPGTFADPDLSSNVVFVVFYFFPFFCCAARGGVTGLPELRPPYGNFFLSAGFNIWNEHMRVSSTDIMAPALSNSPQ